jgi:hypothetical protein
MQHTLITLVAESIAEARADHKCEADDLFGFDIASTIARNLGDDRSSFDGLRFMRDCGFSDDVIGAAR